MRVNLRLGHFSNCVPEGPLRLNNVEISLFFQNFRHARLLAGDFTPTTCFKPMARVDAGHGNQQLHAKRRTKTKNKDRSRLVRAKPERPRAITPRYVNFSKLNFFAPARSFLPTRWALGYLRAEFGPLRWVPLANGRTGKEFFSARRKLLPT